MCMYSTYIINVGTTYINNVCNVYTIITYVKLNKPFMLVCFMFYVCMYYIITRVKQEFYSCDYVIHTSVKKEFI